jgi:hypothetical protein
MWPHFLPPQKKPLNFWWMFLGKKSNLKNIPVSNFGHPGAKLVPIYIYIIATGGWSKMANVSESCMIRLHFPWRQTSACMIPPSTHSPTTTFRVLPDNKWTICSSKNKSWHPSFFISFFLSLSLCPLFGPLNDAKL